MDHEQLLAELRTDHANLQREVQEIKADVREMRDTMLKYRGWLGGAMFVATCVGAFAMSVIHYFMK